MAYGDIVIDITAEDLEKAVKNFDKKANKDEVKQEFKAVSDKLNEHFSSNVAEHSDIRMEIAETAANLNAKIDDKQEKVNVENPFLLARHPDTNELHLILKKSNSFVVDENGNLDVLLAYGLKRDDEGNIVVDTDVIAKKEYIDKLETDKANASDVAQNYANAVKGTGVGVAMLFEDVSPIPHKVKISGVSGTKVYISGKNLYNNSSLPRVDESSVKNGVTITGNSDGTITLNGTSTSSFTLRDTTTPPFLASGTYRGKTSKVISTSAYNLGFYDKSNNNKSIIHSGALKILSFDTSDTMASSILYIYSNTTFDNFVVYPYVQLSFADLASDKIEFEEYKGQTEYIIGDRGFIEVECIAPNMTVLADNEVTVEYNKDVNVNRPLKDKKVMFFGDSITASNERYRSNLIIDSKMKQVGCFAVSGAKWRNSDNTELDGNPTSTSNNTMCNQVQKLLNNSSDYEVPDIIIMSAGTNDGYIDNSNLEEQFTNGNAYIDVDTCDLTTFAGAIRWSVEKVYSLYPNAVIFIATNIQSAETSRKFEQQKIKANIIKNVANRLSIPIIDAFAESGIYGRYETSGANGKYLKDGLHPNADGAKKLAKCYYSTLLNYFSEEV